MEKRKIDNKISQELKNSLLNKSEQQIVIEGNAKIAEFMGFELVKRDGLIHKYWEKYINNEREILCSEGKEKYHTSWDWLIPVAAKCYLIINEKCNELIDNDSDLDDITGWRAWSHARFDLSTNIDKVYERVLQFIDWYNLNVTKD